ncbi:NAD(P)-dependent oxidoreductase [Armatimonas sp.]|uniref:NAD-dependent epimerase/dehydratase family protein n=1 Tax=Armatimonas sp. TaxID=1872638 RepID=UPI00286AE055|nr:NAD(P)-dependent oxidoreductase [Armatimonas sp.]
MKTLITGASGFLARGLAQHLDPTKTKVLGIGRQAGAFAGAFTALDITDFAATLALFEQERPEVVYHLAALSVLQAASGPEGARVMLETNVAGTWNILEASLRVGVRAVVVASSDKQYGALATPPYDDTDSTAFLNGGLYELSKAQQDQVARLYAGLYETPAIRVARLANVYGPGDTHWSRIVPGTIRRTVQQETPRITAGPAGEALREYVFLDDALEALVALANDEQRRGNVPLRREDGKLARVAFNIGSPHRHAAAEVIQTIQTVLREEFGVTGMAPQVQPGTPGVFEPGSQFSKLERFQALLPSYAPRPLIEGLRLTIPWYLAQLR